MLLAFSNSGKDFEHENTKGQGNDWDKDQHKDLYVQDWKLKYNDVSGNWAIIRGYDI